MAKYCKKPVIVDAEVYQEGMEDGWILYWSDDWDTYDKCFKTKKEALNYTPGNHYDHEGELIVEDPRPYIKTLEGKHLISKGDYIVTGIKGERYPVKPDIFRETYEEANNEN